MNELLLDACVLINLIASGVPLRELAERSEVSFRIAELTAAEALFVVADDGLLEPIDLDALVAGSELIVEALAETEYEAFMKLASEVDDGEAATLAIAAARRWPVATDDRKAQRLAGLL